MPRRGYLLIADAADTAPRDMRRFYRLAAALAVVVAIATVLVWQFPLFGIDSGRPKASGKTMADVAILPFRVLNASRENRSGRRRVSPHDCQ